MLNNGRARVPEPPGQLYRWSMRLLIERPSKRYHTSWGEKVITVLSFFFVIALAFLALFAYRMIALMH
jgi:hypothetical protein